MSITDKVRLWERLLACRTISVGASNYDYKGSIRITRRQIIEAIAGEWEHNPLEVTLSGAGDYGGASWEIANARELVAYYGCESGSGHYGYEYAYVVIGEPQWDEETLETLVEIIEGLDDYPCINDESVSNYEMELADEAWDRWLSADVRSDMDERFGFEDEQEDPFRSADEVGVDFFDEHESMIREHYYAYQDNEWYCESATSIINGRHADAVEYALRETRLEVLAAEKV